MPANPQNPPKSSMTPGEHLSYFLHQDKMMWSRLQMLIAVQAMANGGAFSLRQSFRGSLIVMFAGVVLSLCMLWLFVRDREYRAHHGKCIEVVYAPDDVYLSTKGPLGLTGGVLFWLMLVVFVVADVVLMIAIAKQWLR